MSNCVEQRSRSIDDSTLECSEDLPLLSSPSSEPPKESSIEADGVFPSMGATPDRTKAISHFNQPYAAATGPPAPVAPFVQHQPTDTELKVKQSVLRQSPPTASSTDNKNTDSVAPSKIQASPSQQQASPKTNGSVDVVYPTPVRHAAARVVQASTPSSTSGNANTTAGPPPTAYGWIPGGTPPHYHPHPMHMYHHPSPAIYASPDSSPWGKAGGHTTATGVGGSGTKQQLTPAQAPPVPYPWPPPHLPPYPYPPHPHHPYSGTNANGSRYTQAHMYTWPHPHAPPSLNRTTKSKLNAAAVASKSGTLTKFKISSGSAKGPTKTGSADAEDSTRKGGALSPRQIALHHRVEVQDMGCTCKKTRCLKLYCQCFGVRVYCGTNCRCLQCYNTKKHEKQRKEAMRNILSRNPGAFDIKFKKDPSAVIIVPPRPPIPAVSSVNIIQPAPPATKISNTVSSPGADVVPAKLETVGSDAAANAAEASRALAHRLGCKCRKSACMKKVRCNVPTCLVVLSSCSCFHFFTKLFSIVSASLPMSNAALVAVVWVARIWEVRVLIFVIIRPLWG
jgi:Tesmin/TSO1-like CXC domain, cysteine-rich domain